jgi:N utilization substance protein B
MPASPLSKWPVYSERSGTSLLVDMSERHKARENALQMLFQWDMNPSAVAKIEAGHWRLASASPENRLFSNRLFEAAVSEAPESDRIVLKAVGQKRSDRLASIDRSILRLAIAELRMGVTSPKILLSEAVELAQGFSTQRSTKFLNGVLNAIFETIARPAGTETHSFSGSE